MLKVRKIWGLRIQILFDFYLLAGCCDKIYIRDPTNTVKRVHPRLFDITFNYRYEDETKIKEDSAFPYYYTSENGFAIWFLDEFGQWVIGEEQNR